MVSRNVLTAIWIIACCACMPSLTKSPAHAAGIQAGVASVDITPPVGGKTTGYSSAQPTDAVHDPLSARVLVLKTDDVTVALVSWDLCIVNSPWLFEQVGKLGIDHLLLMNTHTHAGPKLAQEDFPSPTKARHAKSRRPVPRSLQGPQSIGLWRPRGTGVDEARAAQMTA